MKRLLLLWACLMSINVTANQFDQQLSVGNPVITGSASYDPQSQQYRIKGAGANMWFKQDQMHYLYKQLRGDFILRTQVAFIGEGVDPHRKIGWTVRNNLDTSSAQVTGVVHGDGLTSLQFRRQQGQDTEQIVSEITQADILQLERRGNTYIFSAAPYGEPLQSVQVKNVELGDNPYIGLFVCSHNPQVVEQAVFSNVRIITPAAPDFKPYQDYIGSNLELMDVQSGRRKIIHSAPNSLQAPNWTHDGSTLIYNAEGKLYNYDLASGNISELNTGFATDNNNDHVLSWDGKQIAISHHNPDDERRSTAYILPLGGSDNPVQINKTGAGHTFLHGWSPDDKNLIFTGQRDNKWNIVKINIATGQETLLTDNNYLDDGSEYAPDGEHIYFNSTRTGSMKIWRMKADGSEPTQLTFDEYNDWFPHISPDGKQMIMLSYLPDVAADDHPFYRQVYLRMMPTDLSRTPKVIAYIYGGQGTINVPSWSPDGKTVSFISNSMIEVD
ncbi:TolB family protein [Neptunicella sp. SCSIO 80796]|uniref:TolB family protein n=1 Tax=Neptunicella plasticusilytica TaxID=3117012 RepID=UPI003A4D32B4